MRRLEGKTAVITGGTRGLGYGIARAFLEEGAAVVTGSRSQQSVDKALKSLSSVGNVTGQRCDVSNMDDVRSLGESAVRTYGRIDIWVNNAGLSAPYGRTMDIPSERFEAVVGVNILGTYFGSRVALEHFVPQRGGKLINLLGRGDRKPVAFQNAYASSKAWIRAFTTSLAEEYRGSGVDIFALNPGLVLTDMIGSVETVRG